MNQTIPWPSHERWAELQRLRWNPDAVRWSLKLEDFASPHEVVVAMNDVKLEWKSLGDLMKSSPRGSVEYKRAKEEHRGLNAVLQLLREGYVPVLRRQGMPSRALPASVALICERCAAARDTAMKADKLETASAARTDDAAWTRELERRARFEAQHAEKTTTEAGAP